MRTFIITLFLLLIASQATAQDENFRLALSVGAQKVDTDVLAATRATFDWRETVDTVGCVENTDACLTDFKLGLQLPLRLLIDDQPPRQDGIIRTEDWDEPSDVLRLVRELSFGGPSEALYARFGTLTKRSFGHRSIVDQFNNTTQIDTHRPGIEAKVNTRHGGIEFLLDDVTTPGLVAGRGFVRPFADGGTDLEETVAVGVTFATDFRAPILLSDDPFLDPVDTAQPRVAKTSPTSVGGIDLEIVLLDLGWLDFVPYADINIADGLGTHIGATSTARFPEFDIFLRGEFVGFQDGYMPGYFSPVYMIERYEAARWGTQLAAPLSQIRAGGDSGSGSQWSLGVDVWPWFAIELDATDTTIKNGDAFGVRLNIQPIDRVRLGAFYFQNGLDSVFEPEPEKALLEGELFAEIWGPIFAGATVSQRWAIQFDGTFSPVVSYGGYAGVQHLW